MKSLSKIYKANGQDPKLSALPGKFLFNSKAGCLVYTPASYLSSKERVVVNNQPQTCTALADK